MPALSPFTTDRDEPTAMGRLTSIHAPSELSPFSPQSPAAAPAAAAPNVSQGRLNALSSDLQTRANQYGAQAFNQHWGDLTSKIDPNDNTAVEKFAQEHGGVTRGQVGMNGQYHTMNNEELLAAARTKYQPSFQRTLTNDPTYQSFLNGTHPTVAPLVSQRLDITPFDTDRQAAGVQAAQNTAASIPVYAGAAADAGKGALYHGEGAKLQGQAANTAADSQATTVDPARADALRSQAGLNNANAGHVEAMTPFDTAYRQAEADAVPTIAQNAADARDLKSDLTQSQIDKNDRGPAQRPARQPSMQDYLGVNRQRKDQGLDPLTKEDFLQQYGDFYDKSDAGGGGGKQAPTPPSQAQTNPPAPTAPPSVPQGATHQKYNAQAKRWEFRLSNGQVVDAAGKPIS